MASVSFWLVVFPMDVIKSRVQSESPKANISDILHHILATEGIRGLYRGIGPILLRMIPVTGLLFATYENTKVYLTHFSLD